ncbi:hypothetical protein LY78DRAFT_673452 [Colletotrichum sublineola]|nr:hypothetical protein LY78DRAFT_673452 [Colletotrichum sublineola]
MFSLFLGRPTFLYENDADVNISEPQTKMKDPLARRWNEVSLSKLNARLVACHEALPGEMRWKRWSTNKDVLQPSVACLHTFYHSTRICLNLPFITSVREIPTIPDGETEDLNNPIIKSFKICQSSAQMLHPVETQVSADTPFAAAPAQEKMQARPPSSKFRSPEQGVWDPMSLLDNEAAYWGSYRNDPFDGWDPEFANGIADIDWLNQPHVPE